MPARILMPAFALATAALLLIAGAAPLAAQGEAKPGPEHDVLKEGSGTWDATIMSMGSEMKGVQTAKMGLGGLWLIEDFKGDFGGQPFEGHGTTTYDAASKQYVTIWIDSMSTQPIIFRGSYDKATKTMKMSGEMTLPGEAKMKLTQTVVTKDADTRVFTMSATDAEGKSFEMMTITYKRRK